MMVNIVTQEYFYPLSSHGASERAGDGGLGTQGHTLRFLAATDGEGACPGVRMDEQTIHLFGPHLSEATIALGRWVISLILVNMTYD